MENTTLTNALSGLTEASKKVYKANKEKGFWDNPRPITELCMLIVTEIAEAVEADRKGQKADMATFYNTKNDDDEWFKSNFEECVKDSVEDEIADALIRILDLCGGKKIDIENHVKLKLRYNTLRPKKHGKKY